MTHRLIIFILCFAVALATESTSATQTSNVFSADQAAYNDPTQLEPGKLIAREIAGGDTHHFAVSLTIGQYLKVSVAQVSIDVSITLFSPNRDRITESDSLSFADGREVISTLAEAAGIYTVTVRAQDEPDYTGRYEINITDLRDSTDKDRSRAGAERYLAEAEEMRRQQTLAASKDALRRYEEALPLWREAEDRLGEAATQNKIGWLAERFFPRTKALAALNEALMLRRGAGDRPGEAETLTNLGFAYDWVGDRAKLSNVMNWRWKSIVQSARGEKRPAQSFLLGAATTRWVRRRKRLSTILKQCRFFGACVIVNIKG